ncbi:neurogenic protein mastermind isoform X2 [Drosophila pseudoobscura]|uniref:Neurogenic protein mastermind isoform X2 n=1 Tax=Drosophila pseudoobscura pseudoobscura TaxID=46245 RepID=A0A6I8W8A5_DROPS|nr:neurogenic protein mastermind isoform X2 [Drosophila pseudoobscura]
MGVASTSQSQSQGKMLWLPLLALMVLNGVDAYSKYGRGCGDIGCLPNEECIITSDSCSYNQRDGKDCGNYPTCKRRTGSTSSSGSNQASPSVNPSGSSLNTGPENNIFAPASSNPTLNTYTGQGHQSGHGHGNGHQQHHQQQQQQHQMQMQHNGGGGGGNSGNGGGGGGGGGQNAEGAAGASSTGVVDPHYVFGAQHHMPVIPNMPIFPYNSPTSAPSFQQFPQPNHPGSVLNPGYPMHGLQPVNPYNPPFVFGQIPFYGGSPSGTGGPPNGGNGGGNVGIGAGVGLPSSTLGILGGGGGGLAPYGSNYQGYQSQHSNANMFNKPPPQYQNQNQQNPYNRRTQAHPSAAAGSRSGLAPATLGAAVLLGLLLAAAAART